MKYHFNYKKVRELVRTKKIKVIDIAARLGISDQTYYNYVSLDDTKRTEISSNDAIELANILGVPAGEIFTSEIELTQIQQPQKSNEMENIYKKILKMEHMMDKMQREIDMLKGVSKKNAVGE